MLVLQQQSLLDSFLPSLSIHQHVLWLLWNTAWFPQHLHPSPSCTITCLDYSNHFLTCPIFCSCLLHHSLMVARMILLKPGCTPITPWWLLIQFKIKPSLIKYLHIWLLSSFMIMPLIPSLDHYPSLLLLLTRAKLILEPLNHPVCFESLPTDLCMAVSFLSYKSSV
jgi:hypothetical protein